MSRWRRRAAWSAGTILLLFLSVSGWRLVPHPAWQDAQPHSTQVLARDGSLLRLTLAADERYRLWRPRETFPPRLVEAVLLKEDRWFFWHPGVNPVSSLRALVTRLGDAQSEVGASTLTMQLARIDTRMDTRSIAGKARQMGRALALSASYSKPQVLEAYLNLAPMAGNVEGFGTASLVYFGKPVAELNLVEILTLAVLPQRPQLIPHAQGLQLTPFGHQARARLFEDWILKHPEDARYRGQIATVTVLKRPSDLPFRAPHAVDQALRLARMRGLGSETLQTTIDSGQQRMLEQVLTRYLREQAHLGFTNGSVLLVDVVDGEIRTMVGSANYFDSSISGQINGTQIKRSPGSTLKPLLYGLAIDQGQIHPASVLRDVPTRFGPFSPENFDGEFIGPITAQEALVRSRNIPAVQIASRLRQPNLYALLKAAQVERMALESHYGLALVLGGGDLNAQELAGLYAMLGRQGRHRRPVLLRDDLTSEPGLPLLSPEASFVVRDMLEHHPRPDGQTNRLPVAWKTGTSWGFHDAWTAGLFGRYVLIVWLGTPDHRAHANLVGVQAAAPLFFRMVDALTSNVDAVRAPVDTTPLNLRRVAVCEASGDLPNAECPRTVETWFIPGKTTIAPSILHRRVVLDRVTGKPVCAPSGSPGTRTEVFAFWPSELLEARRKAGVRERPAPDLPSCHVGAQQSGRPPLIQSPRRTGTYLLGTGDSIGLMASSDASQSRLFWYADGALIGVSAPEQSIDWVPPRAGAFTISVSDTSGRSEQRQVQVGFLH